MSGRQERNAGPDRFPLVTLLEWFHGAGQARALATETRVGVDGAPAVRVYRTGAEEVHVHIGGGQGESTLVLWGDIAAVGVLVNEIDHELSRLAETTREEAA